MIITKAKRRDCGFCTKAGGASVTDIDLLADEKTIAGTWDRNLRQTRSTNTELLDAYANCPSSPKKVLQFARKHGPVCIPAIPGEEFTFPVVDWLATQTEFRNYWDKLVIQPGKAVTFAQMFESWSVPVEPEEFFTFHKGQLLYKASTLHRLLVLELYSISPDRVRKCRWPTCQTPYYIAGHLRQRYCGEICRDAAQRQHALKYYHSKGSKRRREATSSR